MFWRGAKRGTVTAGTLWTLDTQTHPWHHYRASCLLSAYPVTLIQEWARPGDLASTVLWGPKSTRGAGTQEGPEAASVKHWALQELEALSHCNLADEEAEGGCSHAAAILKNNFNQRGRKTWQEEVPKVRGRSPPSPASDHDGWPHPTLSTRPRPFGPQDSGRRDTSVCLGGQKGSGGSFTCTSVPGLLPACALCPSLLPLM